MTKTLTLALAQLNPVVGDISGNLALAQDAHERAGEMSADLLVLSELFLSGYPPEDLVLKPAFLEAVSAGLSRLAEVTRNGPAIVIGVPWRDGDAVYNAAALLADGEIQALRYKHDLPNYGVFDEKRVFVPGPLPDVVRFRGVRLGLPICEDMWRPTVFTHLARRKADLFLVLNGSPYSHAKWPARREAALARVRETQRPLVYVNQVGGQDELVFDGASFVLSGDGKMALQMGAWTDDLAVVHFQRQKREGGGFHWHCAPGEVRALQRGAPAWYQACVLGLRDYVEKNGFPGVVLGLSGGIDSALCAAISVDALGPERVHCLMLPYRYTSSESLEDAQACAEALGVRYDVVSIEDSVTAVEQELAGLFQGMAEDTTEENIQSRIRGTILMAVSNKFGTMLVTTGNKSEMSVGYATLYGDMNGGFNPIKDIYKTQVYALARYRNETRPAGALGPEGVVIPERILTKAPSAELRPDQTDQDSLPPYEILDDILECLVEREMPVREIVARGHDPRIVARVESLLYVAEYKRRQAAPGVKISERNFGRDRRYPITNRFREGMPSD